MLYSRYLDQLDLHNLEVWALNNTLATLGTQGTQVSKLRRSSGLGI